MQDMNNGGSYFHQLAVKVSRRMSRRFPGFGQLQPLPPDGSRSRYLNNGDLTLEKRVSTYDRPNNFAISGLYQLPFGRGSDSLGGAGGVANVLIGNWAVSTLYTFHSGAPVAWGNMLYYGGDLQYDARNVNHSFDTTRFNTVSSPAALAELTATSRPSSTTCG